MTSQHQQPPLAPQAVSHGLYDRLDDVAVAVVGCGVHSMTAILPALRHARVRLVAVCDVDLERAECARGRFGAERAHRSVEELLAHTDLDAVLVVGPPDLHVSAGIAALESGCHVFVEKPPAHSLADAVRLQQAGLAARKQVMVGFMKRHASAYRLVHQVIAEEEFGSVTSVDVTYAHWPVRDLRTHLLDMSIHALDLVRWLLGDAVRMTVYKRTLRESHVVAVLMEHDGGVSHLDLSAFQPGVQERLSVTGENAVVRVDDLVRLEYVRQSPGVAAEQSNARLTSCWTPEFALPDAENDVLVLQGYGTEMIAFADAIREGTPVSPSIDDGVAAMGLVEAIAGCSGGLSTVDLTTSEAGAGVQG